MKSQPLLNPNTRFFLCLVLMFVFCAISLSPLSLEEECIFVHLTERNLQNSFEFTFEIWPLLTKPSQKLFDILQFKIRSICSAAKFHQCQILFNLLSFLFLFICLFNFFFVLYTNSYLVLFFICHYFRFLQEKS